LAEVLLQDHFVLGKKGRIDPLGQHWVQEIVGQEEPHSCPSAMASEALLFLTQSSGDESPKFLSGRRLPGTHPE
jgi:hypothetical protein